MNTGTRRILFGSLGLILLGGCHKGVPTAHVETLVTEVTHGQGLAVRIFPGPPGSGLTGAVVVGGNRPPVVVWITSDGKSLLAGSLYDARGRDLTVKAAERLAGYAAPAALPSPPPSERLPVALSPEAFRAMASGATSIAQGTGKKTLWIFLDPDCIWCHRLYEDLAKTPLPEDVSLRWVPVAILKPSSLGRARALLAGGLSALRTDEDGFDTKTEEGGLPEAADPVLGAEVRKNIALLQTIGGKETPTLVYAGANGFLRFDGDPGAEGLVQILRAMR